MTHSKHTPPKTLAAFIKRLHFYIGLFVGPFIFISALTGTLYVMTPQLEHWVYHDQLTAHAQGQPQPLSKQIEAAQASLDSPLIIKSVRPAPQAGDTTRVLFRDPTLTRYRAKTVFVDPVTLEVKGDLASYGTSGILPLRITLDFLHKDLLLGDVGRYYSELAASWMWIAALGGLFLWWRQRRSLSRQVKAGSLAHYRSRHSKVALWISAGLIFFSATGLTWSKWAGGNIAQWRQDIGWVTPSPSRQLNDGPGHSVSITNQEFDQVLESARQAGIHAGKIEIVPSYTSDRAWFVREIHRAWPTQVDSVAVNPNNMQVISHAEFEHFPLIAKLIRWGIDAHMGVLFGLPNQLILVAFGLALCTVIIWGYRMWWKRRPTSGDSLIPLTQAWLSLTPLMRLCVIILAVLLGIALPVMGVSLLLFCFIDILRWKYSTHRSSQSAS
ncbi:PepSY-associated TM helix domain-containing protein [Vibrio zhugei]|uniref:PepSY-associated TM helix domain-containing protein n=1 Tax=Vibrio zhugei TaxID=2479546 RepID=A0ABV7CBD3_9VIBR|nr:PepSY-associated TM helix domain-containing protein [Vibrio zhugei]